MQLQSITAYYTLHDMSAEANLDDRQLMLEVPAAQFFEQKETHIFKMDPVDIFLHQSFGDG